VRLLGRVGNRHAGVHDSYRREPTEHPLPVSPEGRAEDRRDAPESVVVETAVADDVPDAGEVAAVVVREVQDVEARACERRRIRG
jgi:hypothetical protein